MSGIAIFMEGGGDSTANKGLLRTGMGRFLKDLRTAAEQKRWRWKLVACGSRNQTFDKFRNARDPTYPHVFLLVDSEGPVVLPRWRYLQDRDGWPLNESQETAIHLMVQVMETWIVADPRALDSFYGDGFRQNRLARADDLETVPKQSLVDALEGSSSATQKGRYHKIRHASALLALMDAQTVRERCPSCRRLFDTVGAVITA